MIRLQKRIADAGIASRRKAEEMILAGRVKVNDVVITEMGYKVSNDDIVKVDNNIIESITKKVYLALNKPSGYICTRKDEFDRKTIFDLLDAEYKSYNLHSLGRLDYDTKGIIILTNDGDFTQMISGPRSGVEKEYLVRCKGEVKEQELLLISRGITYNGEKYLPSKSYIVSYDAKNDSTLVNTIITDGKNHEIKNMFKFINHEVKKLTRVRYGNITLDNIPSGGFRELSIHEIKVLISLSKGEKNLRIKKGK